MNSFFKIKERGSTVGREIVGGVTTFLAMAYILAVNPGILSASGMSWGSVFTATAISAAIATLVMGLFANLPVALAAGLGLNAFFSFTVVLGLGCSWQLALTAVLLEGIIFILLSIIGIREAIIKSIPMGMKKAVSVGIGLFICIIGFENAGIVINNEATLISFATFSFAHKTALLAVIGLLITIVLYMLKVPGAILIGVIATTIIGIPMGVTVVPEDFKVFRLPDAPYFCQFDFKGICLDSEGIFKFAILGRFFVIFFTFLFTDLFDTIGTLVGVANQADLLTEDGSVVNAKQALLSDSIGTVVGACLGTSTVTSYVESTSGVAAGARTGLASVVTAVLFALALFFGGCFAIIPSAATAPALIFVGYLMMQAAGDIDFKDPSEGIPAFIAIVSMPFAYSIAAGIMYGIITYVICKVVARKVNEISPVTWGLAVIFVANIVFEACTK